MEDNGMDNNEYLFNEEKDKAILESFETDSIGWMNWLTGLALGREYITFETRYDDFMRGLREKPFEYTITAKGLVFIDKFRDLVDIPPDANIAELTPLEQFEAIHYALLGEFLAFCQGAQKQLGPYSILKRVNLGDTAN